MEFEWDQNKSEKCFTERGFDFAYAAHAFFLILIELHKKIAGMTMEKPGTS